MAPVTKFGSGYKDQLQIITQEKTLDFGTKDENAFGQELIGTMGDVFKPPGDWTYYCCYCSGSAQIKQNR
ncbi:hypothetical protein CHH80_17400 [Bacillus sp. 7504-2]|nr:hypothetical protein CHH80_17400 [Bacillus sp. 7504-2]